MDKRSVFFVLLVTVALLFVNQYFDKQRINSNRQYLEQQDAINAVELEELKRSVAERSANLEELPVIALYGDGGGNNFLTWAIYSNGGVFAWNDTLPANVYMEQEGNYCKLEKVLKEGSLVIYANNKDKKISIADKDFRSYDVQLVELNTKHPNVVLGQCIDGQFSIPLNKLVLSDAIGVVDVCGTFLPMGIYQMQTKEWITLDSLPKVMNFVSVDTSNKEISADKEEKFYVLENEYLQLVFSNYGGALAEINLPLYSKKNKKSVVKEVEFDRLMKEMYSYNAVFPSHNYFIDGVSEEHVPNRVGGYYPLLRRDLIHKTSLGAHSIAPKYYAMNVVSDYAEVANSVYKVTYFDKRKVVFKSFQKFRNITKTFFLDDKARAPYILNMSIKVDGDCRGLRLTSGVPSVELMSGRSSPAVKVRSTLQGKSQVKSVKLPKDITIVGSVKPDWICNSNGFFGLIINPKETQEGYRIIRISGEEVPTHLSEIGGEYSLYKIKDFPGYEVQLPLSPYGKEEHFQLYAGPFDDATLKTVDATFSASGYNPDYVACQSFHGIFSFISEPFAKFLLILMNCFYRFTNSWTISIVLLTVVLRVMLYPLNAWSIKSMKRMQKIAPLVTEIQKRKDKDPKRAQMEIMNLYKINKVNPLGGCFPMLIQMPFLVGMFDLLRSSFQLRGVSFIPGWINDLTSPDVLFKWDYPIPFIGTSLHLLPLLLGFIMFCQQRMSSSMPKDRSVWTEQQRQQHFMGNMMAIVFSVMFYNFPSGLNIYWLSSTLLGILQQWLINRNLKGVDFRPIMSNLSKKRQRRT